MSLLLQGMTIGPYVCFLPAIQKPGRWGSQDQRTLRILMLMIRTAIGVVLQLRDQRVKFSASMQRPPPS